MSHDILCTTRILRIPDSDLACTVDVRSMGGTSPRPVVVFIHGFRVHKVWGFLPRACDALARAGAHVISYNSRYNGYLGLRSESFNEDLFALNTVSTELADADIVLDALDRDLLLPEGYARDGQIMMAGHSRGCAIALLTAARRPDVRACALWSPIARLLRYSERQKQLWRARGYVRVPESERGPAFRMNAAFLDDLEEHRKEFSLTEAMARFDGRSALIVGAQDLATPPSEARELHRAAIFSQCTYVEIPATGHTFGMPDLDAPLSASCLEALRQTALVFNLPYPPVDAPTDA
ncbi:MAG: alpha/beta hydrolase family protein [Candidatus Kapaibacterium sp.]